MQPEILTDFFQRLQQVRQRYHLYNAIRNTAYFLGTAIYVSLFLLWLNAWFAFGAAVRTTFFYTGLGLFLFGAMVWVIFPVLRWAGILPQISAEAIARIISVKFRKVENLLFTILGLHKLKQEEVQSSSLLEAAYKQKIAQTQGLNFLKAIGSRPMNQAAIFLLSALVVAFTALGFSSQTLKKSALQYWHHDTNFQSTAHPQVIILNDSLRVGKGDDFTIQVKSVGEVLPSDIFLQAWGNEWLMKKNGNVFSHTFKSVNRNITLRFSDGVWSSRDYELQVLEKPVIKDYQLTAYPPEYTGREHISQTNNGNISVPEGTALSWRFRTAYVGQLYFDTESVLIPLEKEKDFFTLDTVLYKSMRYALSAQNRHFMDSAFIRYTVQVAPDEFPAIEVIQQRDSVRPELLYFHGTISDDYGFSKLEFHVEHKGNAKTDTVYTIPVNKALALQDFYFSYSFAGATAGDKKYSYYFQVYDNDGVNGAKSAKSRVFGYKQMTKETRDSIQAAKSEEIEENLTEGMKLAEELQRKMAELKQESVSQNMSSWERSQLLKDIEQKQNRLRDLMKKNEKLSKEQTQMSEQASEKDKELLKKQKQMEELMSQLMDDELKDLLERLAKLREEFDQEEFNRMQEEMKYDYKNLEQQLDRNLELMKKLQVEQEWEQTADKLEELAKNQEELAKDNLSQEEEQQAQENIQKEFDEAQKKLEETLKKNKELQHPHKLENMKKEAGEIQEQLEKMDNQKLQTPQQNQQQQQNSQQMKQMAQKMRSSMQQSQEMMTSLNKSNLKQILSNLIEFSFSNEENYNQAQDINPRNPKYVELMISQKKLQDDFKIINDSLYSLSKKSLMLDRPINKELVSINKNMDRLLALMEERRKGNVLNRQQLILTSTNNLALLLSEMLNNMRMNSGGSGKGQPQDKPNGGKPSLSKMKGMQRSLKQQLENMLKQMEQAGKKPGGQGSKELAKMLAEQEKFQDMLRQLRNKEGGQGKDMRQLLDEISKMSEEVKNDIIERNISQETVKRQNNILTRLLEAEDADREQKREKKREAQQAKFRPMSNPESVFPYNADDKQLLEDLQLQQLKLKDFYEKKYRLYLQRIGQ